MNFNEKQKENDAFLGNGGANGVANSGANGVSNGLAHEDQRSQNINNKRDDNNTNDDRSVESKNNGNKVQKVLRSSAFILYVGHFLSSWGDRMWTFAVAVFLIGLDSESLRLPAIYGLSIGASGLLFKALVGDWVDRTPRMKTVIVALAVQNVSVSACAGVIILLLLLRPEVGFLEAEAVAAGLAVASGGGGGRGIEDNGLVMEAEAMMASEVGMGSGSTSWAGVGGVVEDWWWWSLLCQVAIIAIACIANLASSAMKISIQKDWIVVVSGTADDLAQMNSVIRTIDLLAKILAPIATGVIMSGASHVIGAAFIAGWNLISLIAEYIILKKVYRDNPALKIKAGIARGKAKELELPHSEENDEKRNKRVDNQEKMENGKSKEKYKSEEIAVDEIQEIAKRKGSKELQGGESETLLNGSLSAPSCRNEEQNSNCVADKSIEAEDKGRDEKDGPKKVEAGTTPSLTATKESTKNRPEILHSNLLTTLISGWSTYMRHGVRDAGLGLAFLYMTVLGFDSITIGYAYSQGLCASWLGGLQASGAVMGILGTLSFPSLRRRCGLERTGLFASGLQISCLCLCIVSIFLPGSPFVMLHPNTSLDSFVASNSTSFVTTSPQQTTTTTAMTTMTVQNQTESVLDGTPDGVGLLITKKQCVETPHGSYVSIGVMMAGIILARFGLWNLDLTITQILQEQVEESERGIVNGVQHSLQDLLDMIKFILVIFIPHPKHFAYLVILSFVFVATGGAFYASYATRVGGFFSCFSFRFSSRGGRSGRSGQKSDPAKSSDHPVHV